MITKFFQQINDWLAEAGPNVSITYILKEHQAAASVYNASNPYYETIKSAADKL